MSVMLMASVVVASRASEAACSSEETKMESFNKPSDKELRKRLTPQQYDVVCNEGTEPPFDNAYWNNHEAGIYVDVVSGEPLFSSLDKFDSGTGWPSFTRPLEKANVAEREDGRYGMIRTEVRSVRGQAHLGHVFSDGPGPTGMRYCINSASLRFIPVTRLEAEGYGQYLPLFGKEPSTTPAQGVAPTAERGPLPVAEALRGGEERVQMRTEVATLAGGCFWGMEEILRQVPGVLSTRVGYTGGTLEDPRYPDVKTGRTGHAESIEVTFDPAKISYTELLEKYFFKMHDPTTPNRQGNDIGSQYRSAIFVHSEEQRRVAETVKERVNASGKWKRPIVTEILAAGPFWTAEEYHQKYLVKNPGGYTCHFMRD